MRFRDTNLKLAIKNLFSIRRNDIVVIEPHLGLGDGIICLGLIRELSKKHQDIIFYYACLHRCYHSLSWMLSDQNNVFLFPVSNGRQARQIADFLNARYIQIGIENVDLKQFDKFFYEQHNINFEKRWENASVPPGQKSDILYEELNPNHEPFFLICNSQSSPTMYNLDIENIRNRKIIQVKPLTNNIYDWTRLTFEAEQIHTIDTSFIHFVESLMYQRLTNTLFFYHLARKSKTEFSRRLPWITKYYEQTY